jgi:primosomal protein N' (replication factor Y)
MQVGPGLIQTLTPDNYVIRQASRQDYDSFYDREIALRSILGSPPIADLFVVTVSGLDEAAVLQGCTGLRNELAQYLQSKQGIKILGPAPASVAKINNRFRYRISVSCRNTRQIRDIISYVIREFPKNKKNRGLTAFADLNPM